MANNSPTIKREIKVLIHRNTSKNLNLKGMGPNAPQLDFGKLFNEILEEPFYLVNTKEDGSIDQKGESGSIELHVQRTKETELLLIWGIKAVGTAFLSAATVLGKRFAEWLLKDFLKPTGTKETPELRAQGLPTITVDLNDESKTNKAVADLFRESSEKGFEIELIVEPRI